MNFHEMARRTRVSFTAEATMPAELKGLTSALIQRFVGPMCFPSIANGTVIHPPSTANHTTPNSPTTIFWSAKTARMRRKKRNDVEGTATAKQTPNAISRVWQFPTAPTEREVNFYVGICIYK